VRFYNRRTAARQFVVCLLTAAFTFVQSSPGVQAQGAKASLEAYRALVDAYFIDYFRTYPTVATYYGIHRHDGELEDFSATAHAENVRSIKSYLQRFKAVDASALALSERHDLEFVIAHLNGRLLEEERIQMWRRDPNAALGAITSGIFFIMKRDFAPLDERLALVVAREQKIPAALVTARAVLVNPPRIYTQVAIEQLPGIIDFFKTSVPQGFAAVKNPALRARFEETNAAVVKALTEHGVFLEKDLLPRSNGEYAIGAENYRLKLLYDEMIDVPIGRLLDMAYAQLRKDQELFLETAHRIDPKRKAAEVLAELVKDHPTADGLIPAAQAQLDDLRKFVVDKQIMTVPGDVQAQVIETPPFMRALTFASMDTPGPFETRATEAYYNITLPEPTWPAEKTEEYLRGYNYPVLNNTSVHEVWPGHYMQFLWMKVNPDLSMVRKVLGCGTNSEGWAHYTEQMMLDEGFGNGDPKLRMGQVIDALLRDCRFVAGIQLHTGGWSIDDARRFFVEQGYQQGPVADGEAKRGTSDPTYIVYTLGKLQILELREAYKKKMGAKFTLRDFHDRFVKLGNPPLKIVWREMLGDYGPR
jgi:hypothetical protein